METEQNTGIQRQLWDSMLDADMNTRYWDLMGRRYVKRDRNAKICLAIMSSSAIVGWGFWNQVPWAGKILTTLSALIAIIIPILNYQDKISGVSDIAGNWMQIQFDYENLWFTPDSASDGVESLLIQYNNIKRREAKTNIKEQEFPVDNKLIELCYGQVLATLKLREQKPSKEANRGR